MRIEGVAFDLEGTSVNLEPYHHKAHLLTLEEVGRPMELKEAIASIPHFIGGPGTEIWKDVEKLIVQVPAKTMQEMDQAHYKRLTSELETMPPRPGFVEFVREVSKRGLPVAIGSLTVRSQAENILKMSRLDKVFKEEVIVLADGVTKLKPAPDVFLETARRMGIDPAHQLVFEDSHNGVKAARAAGSIAVGMPVYGFPQALIPIIQNGASRVFMQWNEINLDALLTNLEREMNGKG